MNKLLAKKTETDLIKKMISDVVNFIAISGYL